MIIRYYLIIISILVGIQNAFAQELSNESKKSKNKGSVYFTWGYHRDSYSKSTIRFIGEDYDFRILHAKAHDQVDIDKDFFHTEITIPQYVVYGGYFFGGKRGLGIEVGWDHLKYVVTDFQEVRLKGDIQGNSFDTDTIISRPFLHLEHTNGNNYLMANLVKRDTLLKFQKHHLSAIYKAGAGILFPKTESWILNRHNDGPFRPSGIVVGAAAGLRYEFFRFFFIEPSIKGAFADYTAAKLYGSGRAKQHFFSAQYIIAYGFNFPLGK